jgi:ABC-type branched-subunit amino acid transport system ATPase component
MSHALLEVRNMVKRFGGLTAVDAWAHHWRHRTERIR